MAPQSKDAVAADPAGFSSLTRYPRRLIDFLSQSPSYRFQALVFAAYAAHLLSGLALHAMWRDETQAWLIARDATTFADLFRNLTYEGHPVGWYALIWPFTFFGGVELIKIPQALTALGAMALIIWRGPFSRLELLLLPLSFPLAFEYAVKSRSYALGELLLFLFCVGFVRRWPTPALAVLIAAMCNVHLFFALIGLACAAAIVVRPWIESREPVVWADVAAALIVVAGAAFAYLTARPSADSGFAVAWITSLDPERVQMTFLAFAAMVFGRAAIGSFWLAKTAIGAGVWAIALARWRAAPAVSVFFACSVGSILTFMYVKYGLGDWHRATLFLCLVASIWMARGDGGPSGSTLVPRSLFAIVLIAQAIAGVQAAVADRLAPFSAARETARYLISSQLDQKPIFALGDPPASTVVAYLGVKSVFYAEGMRDGSFVVWDRRRQTPVDLDAFLDRVAEKSDAVLVNCNGSYTSRLMEEKRLEFRRAFAGVVENCSVYQRRQAAGS